MEVHRRGADPFYGLRSILRADYLRHARMSIAGMPRRRMAVTRRMPVTGWKFRVAGSAGALDRTHRIRQNQRDDEKQSMSGPFSDDCPALHPILILLCV